jgi:methylenetetrahydrofolate reductase (NADPH)
MGSVERADFLAAFCVLYCPWQTLVCSLSSSTKGVLKMTKVSFEVYPPHVSGPDGLGSLSGLVNDLQLSLAPEFVSVTCGAGGFGSLATMESVDAIIQACPDLAVVPHIVCNDRSKADIGSQLCEYIARFGIANVLALRGDNPSGVLGSGGELVHAVRLVEFIRRTCDGMDIGVACYPEKHVQANSLRSDLIRFQEKVRAGASYAITQYFFGLDPYFWFLDDCGKLGIDIPIIPGIMLFSDFEKMQRMARIHGVDIPRWLSARMDGYGPEDQAKIALDVVTDMCRVLIGRGVPNLHFFTLNSKGRVLDVCNRLGLTEG